jgi:hypothetical protein
MRRILKAEDGKYHVSGKTFPVLEGSRQQVGHGTAYKTSGGLTFQDLMMNKHGKLISKKKFITEKESNRFQNN